MRAGERVVEPGARCPQPRRGRRQVPVLGDDADDAVAFIRGNDMARGLLESVDATTAAQALDAVADAVRPYERPDGLALGGAAWLVTARHS